VLLADGHVHSEWSWDAERGSMEQTCARAVAVGLPAIAFTEHADYTTWRLLRTGSAAEDNLAKIATPEGLLTPPFGSDAHEPRRIVYRFTDAIAMAEVNGFRPGRDACDYWGR
jgi:hypothetical protein